MQIFVPVHIFASAMGFCQAIVPNYFHYKIKPRMTREKTVGEAVHKALERADAEIPRRPITREELLDKWKDFDLLRESVSIRILRRNINDFVYVGRIDKIIRVGGNILIVDDKVAGSLFGDDKMLQLACYCEGFIQNFAQRVAFEKIFFRIVRRDEGGGILEDFTKEYTTSEREMLRQKFETFEGIYNRTVQPAISITYNKCAACSYNWACRWAKLV